MSVGPRIVPGGLGDVGIVNWTVAQISGQVTGTAPPNLFLVLARHRKLFRGWLRFAGRLMPGGRLPRRDTELVILRVAHLTSCRYELEHHRRLAGRAGLSASAVERIGDGPEAPGWSDREHTLLVATDELHHDRNLSDATWTRLSEHLDPDAAIEFVLLAAHYEMLATTIATLRVPLDLPRPGRR